MNRLLGTAAIRQCRRAPGVPQLPRTEPLQLRPERVPVFGRMLRGVPARRRELAGLVAHFASPGHAPLALDLSPMPFELLLARGQLTAQMPLYLRRKPFGIDTFFAQLDKRGRPTMRAAV